MPSRRRPSNDPKPITSEGTTPEMLAANELVEDPALPEEFRSTSSIVQEVKDALRIRSDYALAKALGVTKATVSRWSTGKGGMSDEVALRAAMLAGRDPAFYLLRLQLERSSAVGVQAVLQPIVRELDEKGKVTLRKIRRAAAGILLGTVAVFGLSALPSQNASAQDSPRSMVRTVYYGKSRRVFGVGLRSWLGQLLRAPLSPPRTVTAAAF